MENITKYAVLNRRTKLRMHLKKEIQCDISDTLVAEAGTLIKVFQHQLLSSTDLNSKLSTVQVINFTQPAPMYENLFECPQENLLKVSEDLWPYIISIAVPDQRLRMLRNREQCRRVIYLKLNSLVSVSGELFGRKSLRYDCIIRYIGPVQELCPAGYLFGMELLHLDSGLSPQSENIPFAFKYMQCDPTLSIFTTADWIFPLPNEVKKKFSALDLLSGTLDKVRSAIGPNICVTGSFNNSSLIKEKKKEPTAKFYDTPALQNSTDAIAGRSESNLADSSSYPDMDRTLQLPSKDSNPLISLGNEDFKQSVENYEKTLERQHAGTLNSQTPTGILKHRNTFSSGVNSVEGNALKPLTIMSLQDRDIIVIDKKDIHESTKNDSNVIVVDKLQEKEIDLADLLGSNWPHTAGDAASMLNKTQKPQTPHNYASGSGGSSNSSVSSSLAHTKTDRNKSPNSLTHFESVRHRALPAINSSDTATLNNYSNILIESVNGNVNADAFNSSEKPLAAREMDFVWSSPLQEVPDSGLGVGSMVEVSVPELTDALYGVVRWIGVPPGAKNVMVGVELEDDQKEKQLLTTDGSFNDVPLFKCLEGRAFFVTPDRCAHDKRFVDIDGTIVAKTCQNLKTDSKMFGQVECPSVPGAVSPLKVCNLEELEKICGKFKGIQGHHNSCYLDATLFSMFTFTSVFDSLLFRPPEHDDISHYANVQKVLREEIVNPLRKNIFVRADRVMKLRKLLDKLSSVSGLTSEEKDPEEFLNSLLAQIMRVEPFLKLNSGQDAYFYQLFVEKDERLSFPTVQQLFEQSFYSSDIKLKEVPSCLIIQMPRFGKNYKMYPRILPSQVLDVTDIIEDSPRQCSVCGKLAEYECRDCFGILQGGLGLESTAFCLNCMETVHMHVKRSNHNSKKVSVPQDFRIMAEHLTVPRLYMELFAVVCIETSHYVAFVKAGSGPDAPWCFFDSMADRKGEKNGYNIPEMITVPDLPRWLSEEGARSINETSSNDKMLPEHAKRLFCDAYMCMYQSTDVMMYR